MKLAFNLALTCVVAVLTWPLLPLLWPQGITFTLERERANARRRR